MTDFRFDNCYICLQRLGVGRSVLICGHAYHLQCIATWGNNHNTCPACRQVDPSMQINHVLPDARRAELVAEIRANLNNITRHRPHGSCQFCTFLAWMGLTVSAATLMTISANVDLHDKLIDATATIAENAAAAAAADPTNLELKLLAELTARDAAAAAGDIDAINAIAKDAYAAAHPELAAADERIAEACARDAAAAAGDPEAIAAVEADKIRATISDPEEMKKWMEDHPEWHTPKWHAKHDGVEQFIKEHEGDIVHNIDDHNDAIAQFIKDNEADIDHNIVSHYDIGDHIVIGHDATIDHIDNIGHDVDIDHDYDFDAGHSFLSDIFHSIHDLFV
jgi:hypothetical protein